MKKKAYCLNMEMYLQQFGKTGAVRHDLSQSDQMFTFQTTLPNTGEEEQVWEK